MCARLKNVCQTCLFDLEYGLPVQVREQLEGVKDNLPQSDVNKEYFIQNTEQAVSTHVHVQYTMYMYMYTVLVHIQSGFHTEFHSGQRGFGGVVVSNSNPLKVVCNVHVYTCSIS